MRMVHQISDGTIWLRTDQGNYGGTPEEIKAECGKELPPLPEGITERVYEPGIRHALSANNSVVDGGPMPWPEGDDMLASYSELAAKRAKREKADSDKIERMRREEIAEIQALEAAMKKATPTKRKALIKAFNERRKGV